MHNDEINIVKPSFNSGWIQITGPLSKNVGVITSQLVNYPCSHYANPVFSWKDAVAVTAIEFMKSSVSGQKYKKNIFVGDYNNGNLYNFDINDEGVFAVGDCALIIDPNTVQHAIREGSTVSKNIIAEIEKKSDKKEVFDYKTKGMMASIGKRTGVGNLIGIQFMVFSDGGYGVTII